MSIRRIAAAVVMSASLLIPAVSVAALSPEQECTQQGGVFSKENGTQTCTFSETPGNNQGGVTKTEEESQKGSSRSSHPEETDDCVVNNGGTHC